MVCEGTINRKICTLWTLIYIFNLRVDIRAIILMGFSKTVPRLTCPHYSVETDCLAINSLGVLKSGIFRVENCYNVLIFEYELGCIYFCVVILLLMFYFLLFLLLFYTIILFHNNTDCYWSFDTTYSFLYTVYYIILLIFFKVYFKPHYKVCF